MKGLFVKDIKLMMTQKNFFTVIFIIAFGMIGFAGNVIFSIGFLTFVISLFSSSTISYDEFDNGNSFLFTLPITRTAYVIEKYCLGLILGCGAWVLGNVVTITLILINKSMSITDLMMGSLMILPMLFIIQSIMFPFHIKFGGDKGRIAIIASIGLVIVLGTIIVKGMDLLFNIDIVRIINNLPTLNIGILVTLSFVIAIILLMISCKISAGIMNKKEM